MVLLTKSGRELHPMTKMHVLSQVVASTQDLKVLETAKQRHVQAGAVAEDKRR